MSEKPLKIDETYSVVFRKRGEQPIPAGEDCPREILDRISPLIDAVIYELSRFGWGAEISIPPHFRKPGGIYEDQ